MSQRVNFRTHDKTNSPDLPRPPKKPGEVWLPAVKVSRQIPWGYRVDPEDDSILLPIVEELELLEKAKVFLREYSSRNVADWLTKESGRPISHAGLLKRIHQEKYRRKAASAYRKYEKLYKKAAEAAKKLENQIGANKVKGPVLEGKRAKRQKQKQYDLEIARKLQDS